MATLISISKQLYGEHKISHHPEILHCPLPKRKAAFALDRLNKYML